MSLYITLLEQIHLTQLGGDSKPTKAFQYGLLYGKIEQHYLVDALSDEEFNHLIKEINRMMNLLNKPKELEIL